MLSPINNRTTRLRCSLYADDAALFVNPAKEEIKVVADLLDIFGKVSGLLINQDKCAVHPVRCEDLDVEDVMHHFSCQVKEFPYTYLGLPLHFKQIRRVDIHPLIDKLGNRLPAWRGRF
jgi:hypothetical protein